MIRRLVFALPELSLNLMFASVNTWFLYYLVSVLHMSPVLAGAAFLIGRFLDAGLDFPAGRLSDRQARSGGRVRLIGLALPLAAASLVLMWLLPALSGGPGATIGVFLAATTGFALFSLFYTLAAVPRLALLPGYARSRDARIRQVAMDMVLAWLAVALASSAFPLIVEQAAVFAPAPFAWSLAAAFLALPVLLFYLPFLLLVEDQPLRPDAGSGPGSLRQGLALLRAVGLAQPLAQFLALVLVPFLLQSILPFYLEMHVGLPADRQFPVLGSVFAAALLTFPVWSLLARRWPGRAQPLAALSATSAGALAMPFLPAGPSPALFAMAAICGIGLSGLALAAWALVPQAVERAQMADSPPGEGLTTAAFTFLNQAAAGVAAMINGITLSLFRPDTAREAGSAIGGAAVMIGWAAALPALGCCLVAALLLRRRIRAKPAPLA